MRARQCLPVHRHLLAGLILNVPQTRGIWQYYLPVRHCWWCWSWTCRKQEVYDNTIYLSTITVVLILNAPQTRGIWKYYLPVRHCWWGWSWTGHKQEVYNNTIYLSTITGGVDPERAANKKYMTIIFTCSPLLVGLILNGPQTKVWQYYLPVRHCWWGWSWTCRKLGVWQCYLPVHHCWWRWSWTCRKQEVYDNTIYLSAIAGGVDPERAANKRYMAILFTCPPSLVALILNVPQTRGIWQYYLPVHHHWWRWSWTGRQQEYDNTIYLSAIAGGVDPERAASRGQVPEEPQQRHLVRFWCHIHFDKRYCIPHSCPERHFVYYYPPLPFLFACFNVRQCASQCHLNVSRSEGTTLNADHDILWVCNDEQQQQPVKPQTQNHTLVKNI